LQLWLGLGGLFAESGADVLADCVAGGRGVEGCAEGGAVEVAVGVDY
jgi:hypothetical protein